MDLLLVASGHSSFILSKILLHFSVPIFRQLYGVVIHLVDIFCCTCSIKICAFENMFIILDFSALTPVILSQAPFLQIFFNATTWYFIRFMVLQRLQGRFLPLCSLRLRNGRLQLTSLPNSKNIVRFASLSRKTNVLIDYFSLLQICA